MLAMHGGYYLQLRTNGPVQARAAHAARIAGAVFILAFAGAGVWVASGLDGYRIVTMPPEGSAFVPMAKTVERVPGAWLANYSRYPWSLIAPVAAFGAALFAVIASSAGRVATAFLLSCAAVGGVVLTAGFALFPFIMPSSTNPASSLTVWDAVSSHKTLQVMFWIVLIFLPIVIGYTAVVYRVLRGTISERRIREHGHGMY
jgi:cytochrome d ubiquinol oxidase subunit II